jgi:hypothetical protein
MLDLRFGVEIETVGLTQEELARAIARAIGGTVHNSYSACVVAMADGRTWKIVPDGSLSGGYRSGEIVSPILTRADMDLLQLVVRAVRKAGARADTSTGIHIQRRPLSISTSMARSLMRARP